MNVCGKLHAGPAAGLFAMALAVAKLYDQNEGKDNVMIIERWIITQDMDGCLLETRQDIAQPALGLHYRHRYTYMCMVKQKMK